MPVHEAPVKIAEPTRSLPKAQTGAFSDEAKRSHAQINFKSLALESRTAQLAWTNVPLSRRSDCLDHLRQLLVTNVDDLAAQLARIRRCTTAEAIVTEIHPLADALRFLARNLSHILKPRVLGRSGRPIWLADVRAEVQRVPHGVVLVIGPGNYPLLLIAAPAIQALAAGNAVWLKPAPGCADLLECFHRLLVEAGFPAELCRVIPDSVQACREALREQPDKVIFTGSAATGREILAQLAPNLTPATMELSGSDACFVRDDADLELAASALAFGITLNRGATCIAPRRVFVPKSFLPTLTKLLATQLEKRDPIQIAPTDATWLSDLENALADGATLLHGTVCPTLITAPLILSAPPELPLLREDIFGPVMSLVAIENDDDALRINARCPFALGASVFSKSTEAARALANRIRAGSVVINDVIVPTADPRLSFGGVGDSGFGVTRGVEGLLEMTHPKVVATNSSRRRRHYEPLKTHDAEMFKALLQLTHDRSPTAKFRALKTLSTIRSQQEDTSLELVSSAGHAQP